MKLFFFAACVATALSLPACAQAAEAGLAPEPDANAPAPASPQAGAAAASGAEAGRPTLPEVAAEDPAAPPPAQATQATQAAPAAPDVPEDPETLPAAAPSTPRASTAPVPVASTRAVAGPVRRPSTWDEPTWALRLPGLVAAGVSLSLAAVLAWRQRQARRRRRAQSPQTPVPAPTPAFARSSSLVTHPLRWLIWSAVFVAVSMQVSGYLQMLEIQKIQQAQRACAMNPSRCPAVHTTPSVEDWVKDQLRQVQARMQAKKPHLPCWLMGEWSATLADLPVQHITLIDDGSYTRTGNGLDGNKFHSIGSWMVEGDTLVWFHATHSGPDIPAPQQLVREGSSKDRFHLRHQDGSLTRFELKKWVGSVGCRR